MAISCFQQDHITNIMKIDGFFSSPFLTLGVQVNKTNMWDKKKCPTMNEILKLFGVEKVDNIDFIDQRANLQIDLSEPVNILMWEKYGVVADIGTLEHVFDTRMCMENSLRMVKVGGLYVLHTPVKGYFQHGLHTFNPEALINCVGLNGFEIVYCKYSSRDGKVYKDVLREATDALIWLVGRKVKPVGIKLTTPLQKKYTVKYNIHNERGAL